MHKKRENNLRCFLLRAENETTALLSQLKKIVMLGRQADGV